MKNFYFPQIFQPVLEDSNSHISTKWQMTSRRIQTQIEITNTNQNQKTCKFLKSPRQHFLIQPPHMQGAEKQNQFEGVSWTVHEKNANETQVHFEIPYQTLDTSNPPNQANYPIFRSKKMKRTNISVQAVKDERRNANNFDKKAKQNQLFTKDIKKTNERKKKQKFERKKNINHRGSRQEKKQLSKIVTVEDKKEKQKITTIQETVSKHQNLQKVQPLKSVENQDQNNQNEKKQEQKKIQSKQKRRFAMENPNKIEVEFDATSEIKKILMNNEKLLQAQSQAESSLQGGSGLKILRRMGKYSDKQYRNKTFHCIQTYNPPNRHLKRSFTIWDQPSSSSLQDNHDDTKKKEEQKNQEKIEEKVKDSLGQEKKKKQKKVHFHRPSIEQKTKIGEAISNKQIVSIRRVTLKGIPKRSKDNREYQHDISEVVDKKQKNTFPVVRVQKKAEVVRKQEVENVYNQLNYFRMRLNATQKEENLVEVNRSFPVPITMNVENVRHQLENERIERTKTSNMMIDFGVRLTRDYFLKQVGIREKILKFAI